MKMEIFLKFISDFIKSVYGVGSVTFFIVTALTFLIPLELPFDFNILLILMITIVLASSYNAYKKAYDYKPSSNLEIVKNNLKCSMPRSSNLTLLLEGNTFLTEQPTQTAFLIDASMKLTITNGKEVGQIKIYSSNEIRSEWKLEIDKIEIREGYKPINNKFSLQPYECKDLNLKIQVKMFLEENILEYLGKLGQLDIFLDVECNNTKQSLACEFNVDQIHEQIFDAFHKIIDLKKIPLKTAMNKFAKYSCSKRKQLHS